MSSSRVHIALWGGIAGIAGGLVFFLVWLLAAGPLVVQVLESIALGTTHITNPVIGFASHIVISIIIGILYAEVLSMWMSRPRYRHAILPGLLNGVIWWVIGGLVILPLLLGMPPQFAAAFTPTALVDLAAHLVYGVVTALVLVWMVRRGENSRRQQELA